MTLSQYVARVEEQLRKRDGPTVEMNSGKIEACRFGMEKGWNPSQTAEKIKPDGRQPSLPDMPAAAPVSIEESVKVLLDQQQVQALGALSEAVTSLHGLANCGRLVPLADLVTACPRLSLARLAALIGDDKELRYMGRMILEAESRVVAGTMKPLNDRSWDAYHESNPPPPSMPAEPKPEPKSNDNPSETQ